jgi:O-antigen/teichoic acid export membrane protein
MNLGKLISWISHQSQNSSIRNTLWMMLAQGMRSIMQATYFIIIARALGVEQYGIFVGMTALVAILSPFASLGAGNLLIKNISRDRVLFNEYWGNALLISFFSGLGLIALVLCIAPVFLPKTVTLLLIFLVAVTDLIFARILDVAGQAFQSVLWLKKTAQLNILSQATRLIAAFTLVRFFPHPGILEWAFLYSIGTAISALLGVLLVHQSLGCPKLAISRIKPEITEGFYFSVSLSAQTIYNDIDKAMLASLSSLEATGIYSAAYRLIDVAFVPVKSLLAAVYAKFFQNGAVGISGTIGFSKRLSPIAGIYGLTAGIGLFLLAPVIPHLLGHEYEGAVEALRWLAPLPFLKAMHYFAADTLTGAGFQGARSTVQAIAAAFNVLVNVWLIPLYSWRGAAWSSLASDTFLMLSLWMLVVVFHRQQVHRLRENQ